MKRALPLLVLLACRTPGPPPPERSSEHPAEVTDLALTFQDGKGELRFTLKVPRFREPTEVHWQLTLDARAIASGVAVVQPLNEQVTLVAPIRPKAVRFDEGARRVDARLTGDAGQRSAITTAPLTFAWQQELVLVGAPVP